MLFNIYFSTEFDARMQEKGISGLLDSKIFWGGMPPDHPRGRGLAAPEVLPPPTLIGLPPTSELIETPGGVGAGGILSGWRGGGGSSLGFSSRE